MDTNQLKLIINAAEKTDFEIDTNFSLEDNYENAYYAMRDYAINEVEGLTYDELLKYKGDAVEVQVGQFSNHYSHISAQANDGTEYECDGHIINGNEEGGEVVGDFIDKDGKMVIVIFPKEG